MDINELKLGDIITGGVPEHLYLVISKHSSKIDVLFLGNKNVPCVVYVISYRALADNYKRVSNIRDIHV